MLVAVEANSRGQCKRSKLLNNKIISKLILKPETAVIWLRPVIAKLLRHSADKRPTPPQIRGPARLAAGSGKLVVSTSARCC